MGFRTVIIDSHSKLEYSMNSLVFKTIDSIKRIYLDEIHTIIIQSTQVSITTSLLNELLNHKITVIFCNEKHNPSCELLPLSGSYNGYKKISEQIRWSNFNKNAVWKEIIKQKILNQINSLKLVSKFDEAKQLSLYYDDVQDGDVTNREGHAAKVYFNSVFYDGFVRNEENDVNVFLNYGYSIILSAINRTIASYGYLTQLGIHHIGETNPFNLSSDIIETFRFLVDEKIINKELTKNNFREVLVGLLNMPVLIEDKNQSLSNAINIHVLSILDALRNGDVGKIKFISRAKHDN